jgi:thiol-disulfide isomerase/thioredoxin
MQMIRPMVIFGVLGVLAYAGLRPLQSQQPAAAVTVKVLKYGDLADFVAANKGRVIVVDFWATTCIACKQSFFHTVEMSKAYRDQGLVVASVSTDNLQEDESGTLKARVVKFLQSQDATFTNVILDEPAKLMQDKLRLQSLPCMYVFNRDGQWTQFIGNDLAPDANHRHPNVEQYVKQCLAQTAKKN